MENTMIRIPLQAAATVLAVLFAIAGCGGSGATPASLSAPQSVPPAQTQTAAAGRIDRVGIDSAALKKTMGVEVYLPYGYSTAQRYPVVYMFYGYGGNEDTFFSNSLPMNVAADTLISQGRIPPMIIVVPNYANSFAVNTTVEQQPDSAGGTIGLYEDYVINEVLPYIDAHYSTAARREQRYVGGFSMGGFAALYLGLRHVDLFSKVGGHSAALWDYDKTNSDQFLGQRDWLYATPALRQQRDPMLLAAQVDVKTTRFYLDGGNADQLLPKDSEMADILRSRGAAVEWHANDGGHNLGYWNAQLGNYLLFYGAP